LRIALVPTMGSLHDGHLALVREARGRGDRVVVSIFVNPTQFGANEDLDKYPRDLDADLAKLAALDVDAVFVPNEAVIYPPGFDTWVVPGELAQPLCGASRPDHFRGVATVVLILLRLSRCHVALFGEKDFQQLQIIRRMAADLWLDVEIVGCPIVRERDGLAMSSRNAYLSPEERRQALVLSQGLARAELLVEGGERRAGAIAGAVRDTIAGAPAARVDYVELVDSESLAAVERVEAPVLCAIAAWVGRTRLIDNRVLSPAAPAPGS
jgi:pantoate--beta-alanine ligase